jgi:hypothetical protein
MGIPASEIDGLDGADRSSEIELLGQVGQEGVAEPPASRSPRENPSLEKDPGQ